MHFAALALLSIGLTLAQTPPSAWKEHWFEHNQDLRLVNYTSQVALYYDSAMSDKVTWPRSVAETIWVYTKSVYGNFGSDARLFVVLHTGKYYGGHPSTYFDASHDYRNTIDIGFASWVEGSKADYAGLALISHEISHIVEFASKGVHESPAFQVWGDSKWAEIYVYDVYKKLGWTAEADKWYGERMASTGDSFPRAGTCWFRDWFYPIYRDYGETAVLNSFFELLAAHFPKNGQTYTRRMNFGEFVHFWSGAAETNLKDLALKAFGPNDRDGNDWVAQFDKARVDFSAIQYDQTTAASFIVYDDVWQAGASRTVSLTNACNNDLAINFNDRASSIDTQGECVRLYQNKDCQGTSIRLAPDCDASQGCWPNHWDLSGSGLGNAASSSIRC